MATNRTAPNSTTSTIFSSDALAAVALTGGLQFDGTQDFSLGAWLLIEPGDAAGDIFNAGENFAISISESGTIQGTFGTGSWTPSDANVPVSRWFYLLITVDAADSSAYVSLYFDGALADTVTVSGTGGGTSAQLTFGGAAFQSTALNVFNSVLDPDSSQYRAPDWILPSSGQNTVAAVDFTQNPPVDTGPSSCALSYADEIPCQFCTTPALYLDGGASAYLTSPSPIIPQGKFSLGLWCYVEIGSVLENQITLLQISSTDIKQSLTLNLTVGTNTASVFATTSCNGTTKTSLYQLPIQTWTVIGLSCDGKSIYLSVNDSVVATTDFKGFSESLSSLTLGSTRAYTGTQSFQGYIQSFFTAPNDQSAAAIYTLLTSTLGSQTYGCVLEFGGAQAFDQVTCTQVELGEAKISDQISYSQVSQAMSQALGQRIAKPSKRIARLATGPVIPQQARQHWFAPAKSNNPDILGYNLELYDQLLSAFPDSARKTRLRQYFQQKLQEGFDRAKTGDWAVPEVQCELINGKYRYTLSKPFVENDVYEIDAAGVSPCTSWTIQVAAQCICILLSLFGFAYALAGVVKTMNTALQSLKIAQETPFSLQIIQRLPFYEGPTQAGVIMTVMNEAPVNGTTMIKIVQSLYNSNLLLPSIMNGLSGVSWWNWAFVVTSIVVSIVGIWASGGWYLAIMLAQLAISVAQLGTLINKKPQTC